jgi:hypothetical protein
LEREEKGSRTCVRPENDQRPESAPAARVREFDGQQPATAIELGEWQTAKIGLSEHRVAAVARCCAGSLKSTAGDFGGHRGGTGRAGRGD